MNAIKSRLPLAIVITFLFIALASIHLWLNNKPENEVIFLWGLPEVVLIRTALMGIYSVIFALVIFLFIKNRVLKVLLLCIPLLVTAFIYAYNKDTFPTYIHDLDTGLSSEHEYLAVIQFQRPTMWDDQLVFYERIAPNKYVVTEKHQFNVGHQVAQMLKDNAYQIEVNPLRIVFGDDSTYQIK